MNVFSVYLPSSEALGEDWWTEGVLKKNIYIFFNNSLHVCNTFRPCLRPSFFSLLPPALPPSPYQVPTPLSHLVSVLWPPGFNQGLGGKLPTRAQLASSYIAEDSDFLSPSNSQSTHPHYLPWASLMRPSHREPNQGRLGELGGRLCSFLSLHCRVREVRIKIIAIGRGPVKRNTRAVIIYLQNGKGNKLQNLMLAVDSLRSNLGKCLVTLLGAQYQKRHVGLGT